MRISPKPDYYLPVTIESQRGETERGIIFRGVPCKIFLPKNKHETVIAELELSEGQAQVIGRHGRYFFQMSIQGWLRSGRVLEEIRAKECYIRNGHWPSLPYGCSFVRVNLPLEVLDLTVTTIHEISETLGESDEVKNLGFGKGYKVLRPRKLPAPEKNGLIIFDLTGNTDLVTYRWEEHHFDGSIKVSEGEPFRFDLTPEYQITFNRHFNWQAIPQEKILRVEISTASLPFKSKRKKPFTVTSELLKLVDDFLLLASIGTRWNTIRLGYSVSQGPYITKNYQRSRSLPKHIDNPRHQEKQDRRNALIDLSIIGDFLRHAWPIWKAMPPQRQVMLRQVFQAIIHSRELDLQAGFIALYAALEMMVLNFRRENDLEFVLSDAAQWKQLEKDFKKFISQHPAFAGDTPQQKAKRQKAHEKVSEFNRVAFGTAFNAFCNQSSPPIPHQDLWPVNGKNSLSWMRNQLVHGEVRGHDEIEAIWMAKMHIEWLVERCVLSLLSWRIEKSGVCAGSLSYLTAHNRERWEKARLQFFTNGN